MDADPSWFAARILVEQTFPNSDADARPLYEEQVFLVRAQTLDEAWDRARELGTRADHEYENSDGELVRWQFRELWHVVSIFSDSLEEGVEVYHNFLGEDDVAYLRRDFGGQVRQRT